MRDDPLLGVRWDDLLESRLRVIPMRWRLRTACTLGAHSVYLPATFPRRECYICRHPLPEGTLRP